MSKFENIKPTHSSTLYSVDLYNSSFVIAPQQQPADDDLNKYPLYVVRADMMWCLGKLRGLGYPNEIMEEKYGVKEDDQWRALLARKKGEL